MTFSKVDHNHEFSWPDYNKAIDAIAKHDRRERRLKRAARVFWRAVFLIGALDMALLSFGCSRSEDAQLLVDASTEALRPIPTLESGEEIDHTEIEGSSGGCVDDQEPPVDRDITPFCNVNGPESFEMVFGTRFIPRDATIENVFGFVYGPTDPFDWREIGEPWEHGWAEGAPSTLYQGEWIVEDWPSVFDPSWGGWFVTVVFVSFRCPGQPQNLYVMQDYEGWFNVGPQCDTDCPTEITIESETWSSYCASGTKYGRCRVVFTLDGTLPNGVADLGGQMNSTASPTYCNWHDWEYFASPSHEANWTFSHMTGSTYEAIADGFPYDVLPGNSANFYRSGWIYTDCDRLAVRHNFECGAGVGGSLITLPSITCQGGGGGFEGAPGLEDGKQSPHRMACPAFDGEGACCCDLGGVLPEEWAAYWLGNFGYRQP